jgi:hypothetical protein
MGSKKLNKYGLSRSIPAPTKRAVRQECGYGCVICGSAIYQYEHFKPEWHKAMAHSISGIALLCGRCHDYVTRRIWSKNLVEEARAHPKSCQIGHAIGELEGPSSRESFTISMGGCEFIKPRSILRILGIELLTVRPPEAPGAPMRISGAFFTKSGKLAFEIDDNEFRGKGDNWDIETVGRKITVRTAPGSIALQLRVIGRNHLAVDRLDMLYADIQILANQRGIWIGEDNKEGISYRGSIVEADCAIDISRIT